MYVLLTERNTLYCGYTDDVQKRFKAHVEGHGAKYTRANKPIKLIYSKEFKTKQEAMRAECSFKKLTRPKKLKLLNLELF